LKLKEEIVDQLSLAQKENAKLIVIATTDKPWNLQNDVLN